MKCPCLDKLDWRMVKEEIFWTVPNIKRHPHNTCFGIKPCLCHVKYDNLSAWRVIFFWWRQTPPDMRLLWRKCAVGQWITFNWMMTELYYFLFSWRYIILIIYRWTIIEFIQNWVHTFEVDQVLYECMNYWAFNGVWTIISWPKLRHISHKLYISLKY